MENSPGQWRTLGDRVWILSVLVGVCYLVVFVDHQMRISENKKCVIEKEAIDDQIAKQNADILALKKVKLEKYLDKQQIMPSCLIGGKAK